MTRETIYSNSATSRVTGILASIDTTRLGPAKEHLDRAYQRLVAIVQHMRDEGCCASCPTILLKIRETCLDVRENLWHALTQVQRQSIEALLSEPLPA